MKINFLDLFCFLKFVHNYRIGARIANKYCVYFTSFPRLYALKGAPALAFALHHDVLARAAGALQYINDFFVNLFSRFIRLFAQFWRIFRLTSCTVSTKTVTASGGVNCEIP